MSRRRHRALPVLLMLRENAPGMLVVAAVLAGWILLGQWDPRLARCLEAYDRAPTAADTARVDRTPITSRGWATCLEYRRDGSLDRYRQSVKAGRVARRGTPFIEK